MQTFLPVPNAARSAQMLDYRRLGKQRVEALQILHVLRGESSGWTRHPAVRMWRGYEHALAIYGWIVCDEWIRRGYRNNLLSKFVEAMNEQPTPDRAPLPPWVGDGAFHRSHQSNLVRKMPAYYRPLFPDVSDDLPYVWPV